MINMWEQVRMNRRRSVVLMIFMGLLLTALGFAVGESIQRGFGLFGMAAAAGFWVILLLVAYFQGDRILLAVSGATEIEKKDHPRLFNVVEEMCVASGLPKMPRVFIINDMSLNAFATGRKPEKAAVAVTAGLLGKLNRDQLQGVVAHEISHIVNRDVLLMTIVGVTLGAIVMISEVFLRGLIYGGRGRSRRYRSSRRSGGGGGIMIIVAIVLAILAPILAQIIYFAISRRREYLADASGAILTRYPEGLAGALEVISRDGTPLARLNKATAPMYISNPFEKTGRSALGLSSTHPPIRERIRILRGMAGQVSFARYDAALKQVKGVKSGVIPTSALQGDQPGLARAAHPDAAAAPSPRARMRQAGDLVMQANRFRFIQCPCGVKIKIPPDYNRPQAVCPRCRRSHPVANASARPGIRTAKPRVNAK